MIKTNSIFGKNLANGVQSKKIRKVNPKRDIIDIKNYRVLKSLKGNYNDKLNIKFNLIGGGTKIIPINNSFFVNDNRKKLNEANILEKLNTLKHDFCAEDYIINKF